MDMVEEWYQVLSNNIGMLTAIETEFSVIIFTEKHQVCIPNMGATNIHILKDLLQTPINSEIYRNFSRGEVEIFLCNRPSGSLISMSPVLEEYRLAFVYHAKKLVNLDMNSENITSRIHDDMELNIILPKLPSMVSFFVS